MLGGTTEAHDSHINDRETLLVVLTRKAGQTEQFFFTNTTAHKVRIRITDRLELRKRIAAYTRRVAFDLRWTVISRDVLFPLCWGTSFAVTDGTENTHRKSIVKSPAHKGFHDPSTHENRIPRNCPLRSTCVL